MKRNAQRAVQVVRRAPKATFLMHYYPPNMREESANSSMDHNIGTGGIGDNDTIAMAQAFQNAQVCRRGRFFRCVLLTLGKENDTMRINNVASSATRQEDVNDLQFFLVDFSWFKAAWPVLKGRQRRDSIGPIENRNLLKVNSLHQMSGSSGTMIGPNCKEDAPVIKSGKHHGDDYVIVGANVWLLLSQKFGYDRKVELQCKYKITKELETCLALYNNHDELVKVPPSGRFPYEQYVGEPIIGPQNIPSAAVAPRAAASVAWMNTPATAIEDEEDTQDLVCTLVKGDAVLQLNFCSFSSFCRRFPDQWMRRMKKPVLRVALCCF